MISNLRNMKKSLHSIGKKRKELKNKPRLMLSYFLMGMMTFLAGKSKLNDREDAKNDKGMTGKLILMLKEKKSMERERFKKSDSSIFAQSSDRGNPISRSPWNSWQVGIDTGKNSWDREFFTRENLKEYPFEGILTGTNDIYERYEKVINSGYTVFSVDTYLTPVNYEKKLGFGWGLYQKEIVSETPVDDVTSDEERELLEREFYEEAMKSLKKRDERIFKRLLSEIMNERYNGYSGISSDRQLVIIPKGYIQNRDFHIGLASREILTNEEEEAEKGLYYENYSFIPGKWRWCL